MVLIAVWSPLGKAFVFVVVGVGFVVFYGTPLFATLGIYWAWASTSDSIFDEPAFSDEPALVTPFVIWFIAWFSAIYFLHFKKDESSSEEVDNKKQFQQDQSTQDCLPLPPEDLWKN